MPDSIVRDAEKEHFNCMIVVALSASDQVANRLVAQVVQLKFRRIYEAWHFSSQNSVISSVSGIDITDFLMGLTLTGNR